MNLPATPTLARFEMCKDDARAQALKSFIVLILGKPLSQVLYWKITSHKDNEDTATFKAELTNGSQIEGLLTQRQGQWTVSTGNWRYTF